MKVVSKLHYIIKIDFIFYRNLLNRLIEFILEMSSVEDCSITDDVKVDKVKVDDVKQDDYAPANLYKWVQTRFLKKLLHVVISTLYANTNLRYAIGSKNGAKIILKQCANTYTSVDDGDVDHSQECYNDNYDDTCRIEQAGFLDFCDEYEYIMNTNSVNTVTDSVIEQINEQSEEENKIDFSQTDEKYLRYLCSNLDCEFLPKEKAVRLHNMSGYNDDHRGSDHTIIELDFCPNYKLKTNTMRELIIGMYKIKSHKFDYWYELFIGAKLARSRSNLNDIIIKFNFDHGS